MVDFARLNHITHVIQTDFDVYTGDEVESKAKCVLRYLGAMKKILELPVAAWDCPTTAAGEIDTEMKTKMTWNNGNGQGNGNTDDVYGRLNQHTQDRGKPKFPFLESSGKYALCMLEEFLHLTDGPSARALFEVLECRGGKHAVGSHVVKIWKLVKPPFRPGMETEGEMFVTFCRKLKGAPAGTEMGDAMRMLMKTRVAEQLARGSVIEAISIPKEYVKNGAKATWYNIHWESVQQTPQDIQAMRARLEQKGIPSTGGSPTAPAMQGGYVAPNLPQNMGPQGYANPSPAYVPSAVTQGYAPPQAVPAQGVPPGGFLANVPPNNGNNGQGGQGGGSSW
jgi:hypothetical protein